jgi:hypothetical protein
MVFLISCSQGKEDVTILYDTEYTHIINSALDEADVNYRRDDNMYYYPVSQREVFNSIFNGVINDYYRFYIPSSSLANNIIQELDAASIEYIHNDKSGGVVFLLPKETCLQAIQSIKSLHFSKERCE